MNDKRPNLGAFLRQARERKDLTLRAVEKTTGISNAYLSQLENGKIRQPSPIVLHKLSELYEAPYGDIMSLAGYPVPGPGTDKDNPQHQTVASRIGTVTEEEEEALMEYLEFLRSRGKRGKPG